MDPIDDCLSKVMEIPDPLLLHPQLAFLIPLILLDIFQLSFFDLLLSFFTIYYLTPSRTTSSSSQHYTSSLPVPTNPRLVHFYSSILSSVMFNISDQDIDINNAAKSANLGTVSVLHDY